MKISSTTNKPTFKHLTISSGARESLSECSLDTLKNIQKAGERLKNTKFYHLHVDDDLNCVIQSSKKAFFGVFESKLFKKIKKGFSDNVLIFDDKIAVIKNEFNKVRYDVLYLKEHEKAKVHKIDDLSSLIKDLDLEAQRKYNLSTEKNVIDNQKKVDKKLEEIFKLYSK